MRTAGSTAGLVALGAVLVGCGAAPSRSSATYTAANAVAAPAPATAAPALAPTLHESVVGGGPYAPVGPGPLVQGPLVGLARRTTGTVTLRTFTQAWPRPGGGCDVLNQQCPPPWCQPTGLVVTELSTEAMAAVRTSPVIGLGPGSQISLLDTPNGSTSPYLQARPPVGAAEGSPVQLAVVRVAADVATVRLSTADGHDSATPVRGLAVLAVAGHSTSGRLTALTARGRQVASVALSATPTVASAACQPLPPALPVPGRQPADRAAAEKSVRAAFHTAFTHVPPGQPYSSLAAVEGGSALHGALDQLRANFPQAVQTVTVSTGPLVFTNPTTAVVQFTLSYSGGAPYGTKNGTAVLQAGRWLVSRGTYCTVLGYGAATCPAG